MPFDSISSRKSCILIDCRFPIVNCRLKDLPIGNRKLAIGNEKSRAKQRGTSNPSEVFGSLLSNAPSCLAVCFTWPQVALTHHAFRSEERRVGKECRS